MAATPVSGTPPLVNAELLWWSRPVAQRLAAPATPVSGTPPLVSAATPVSGATPVSAATPVSGTPPLVSAATPVSTAAPVSAATPVSVATPNVSEPISLEESHSPVAHISPPVQLEPEPPYGILKRGNKPTFRQWNKTHKNRPVIAKPKELVQQIKKKYTLGRNKNKNRISVFLKNKKTRRKIQDEMSDLKKKPIDEIKEYFANII